MKERKYESHEMYNIKEVLQSVLRGKLGIAEKLIKRKNEDFIFPTKERFSVITEKAEEKRKSVHETETDCSQIVTDINNQKCPNR